MPRFFWHPSPILKLYYKAPAMEVVCMTSTTPEIPRVLRAVGQELGTKIMCVFILNMHVVCDMWAQDPWARKRKSSRKFNFTLVYSFREFPLYQVFHSTNLGAQLQSWFPRPHVAGEGRQPSVGIATLAPRIIRDPQLTHPQTALATSREIYS